MKLLHAATLFATLGLALAQDFFLTLGIEATYPMIGAFGFAITTLLIFRGIFPVIGLAILLGMMSLPAATLQQYHFSHDVVLAMVLTIVVYPWIRRIALN